MSKIEFDEIMNSAIARIQRKADLFGAASNLSKKDQAIGLLDALGILYEAKIAGQQLEYSHPTEPSRP